MKSLRLPLLLLLVLAVPLMACGVLGGREAPAATATPRESAVRSTPNSRPTPNNRPPKHTPTPATTDGDEDAGGDSNPMPADGEVRLPEQIDEINSYRFASIITMSGDAFESDTTTLTEASVVKDQDAYEMELTIAGVKTTIVKVGDFTYTRADVGVDLWVRSPAEGEMFTALDSFVFVAGQDYLDDLDQMENLGTEEIDGRPATHYRADREALAAINEDAIDFDFSQADEAQLDIWIDNEFNFPIKSDFVGEGVGMSTTNRSESGRMELHSEFNDINSGFTIDEPSGNNVVDE